MNYGQIVLQCLTFTFSKFASSCIINQVEQSSQLEGKKRENIMKTNTLDIITEFVFRLSSSEKCYIFCTINGLDYDFGFIPTANIVASKDSLTFESETSSIQFLDFKWKSINRIGDFFDYMQDERNGITMSFSM